MDCIKSLYWSPEDEPQKDASSCDISKYVSRWTKKGKKRGWTPNTAPCDISFMLTAWHSCFTEDESSRLWYHHEANRLHLLNISNGSIIPMLLLASAFTRVTSSLSVSLLPVEEAVAQVHCCKNVPVRCHLPCCFRGTLTGSHGYYKASSDQEQTPN